MNSSISLGRLYTLDAKVLFSSFLIPSRERYQTLKQSYFIPDVLPRTDLWSQGRTKFGNKSCCPCSCLSALVELTCILSDSTSLPRQLKLAGFVGNVNVKDR